VELPDMFVIQPAEALWFGRGWEKSGKLISDGFRYASNTNPQWLTIEQLKEMVAPFEKAYAEGKMD
jgi:UDP-N-acetylglucosamine 4,6-dehydratase/5-epimerase